MLWWDSFIAGVIKPTTSLFTIEEDIADEHNDKESDIDDEGDDN